MLHDLALLTAAVNATVAIHAAVGQSLLHAAAAAAAMPVAAATPAPAAVPLAAAPATVPSPAAAVAAFSPAAAALRDGGLVLSFRSSGFLIFFFAGVLAALESAGVVAPGVTPMAGVSGGAIAAASFHAGMTPAQRLAAAAALNDKCRPSSGCPGRLGAVLRAELERTFPADAHRTAGGPPIMSVYVSKVKGADPAAAAASNPFSFWLPAEPRLVPRAATNAAFLDGIAASSYVPRWSGPGRYTTLNGEAVYDGGPTGGGICPPAPPGGKSYFCLRVASAVGPGAAFKSAPSSAAEAVDVAALRRAAAAAGMAPALEAAGVDAFLGAGARGVGAAGDSDIFIGQPGAPAVSLPRSSIQSYTMLTVPPQYTQYLYEVGGQSARAWMAGQAGLAEAIAIAAARRSAAAAAAAAKN